MSDKVNLAFFLCCALCIATMLQGCGGVSGTSVVATSVEQQFAEDASLEGIGPALAIVKKAPENPKGYTQLASAYIRLGRQTGDPRYNTQALAAVEKALALDKSDVSSRKLKATLMLSSHEFGEALILARQLQSELPSDWFVYGLLTDANAELGSYSDAVASTQKMVDLKPNGASYARVGYIRSLHGDTGGAIDAYKQAARMTDPMDREAQSWNVVQIGNEYWKHGKYDDAVRSYDEALQNFPGYYLALGGKGRALASKGELNAAAELLRQAQSKHLNLDTIFLLGDVYVAMGDPVKAKAQYELAQSGEAGLGSVDDPHRVALYWADNGINLDEAVAIAQEDHAKQKDIYASDTLAWCLFRAGRLDEAQRYAAEAMRIGTPDARILFHAGMIANARGDKKEASGFLKRALDLNPNFDLIWSAKARETLASLQG